MSRQGRLRFDGELGGRRFGDENGGFFCFGQGMGFGLGWWKLMTTVVSVVVVWLLWWLLRPWVVEDDADVKDQAAKISVEEQTHLTTVVSVVVLLGLISFMMCVKVVTKFFNFALMKI